MFLQLMYKHILQIQVFYFRGSNTVLAFPVICLFDSANSIR